MKVSAALLTLGLAIGPSSYAFADSDFVCDGFIVEEGMSLSQVREHCGAPTDESGDRWTYDRGPDELVIVLHIAPDQTISDIEEQPHD